MTKIKSYRDLITYDTFLDRYNYLKLPGEVGIETFGWARYINQVLYNSSRWRETRSKGLIRDEGCDLGVPGYDIYDKLTVHHINPLTIEDIENDSEDIYDMDNLITVSHRTHNAIHYGTEDLLPKTPLIRTINDTCPWK
jgi:hypothetical protein